VKLLLVEDHEFPVVGSSGSVERRLSRSAAGVTELVGEAQRRHAVDDRRRDGRAADRLGAQI
jgi:hypothetical protein